MEILVAKSGGFCHGVKKAVDTALSIEVDNTYIYGEIIHNPDVVQQITQRGIIMVEDLAEVPFGATLIIRSHGVGRGVYELCQERNIRIVDCTCEFVRRTQKIVDEKDYFAALRVINNKGLLPYTSLPNSFGWKKQYYSDYVLRLLDTTETCAEELKSVFKQHISLQ